MVIRHQYPHQDTPWLLQVNYHNGDNYQKPIYDYVNYSKLGNADIRFVNVKPARYDYISSGIIVAIFKCKPKLKP
jgi:hypothetical protein